MAATTIAASVISGLTVAGLTAFVNHFNGDQVWECGPDEANKEIDLIHSRPKDHYPQGRDLCIKFLRQCQRSRYRFRVKAQKTFPNWTWFFEVIG